MRLLKLLLSIYFFAAFFTIAFAQNDENLTLVTQKLLNYSHISSKNLTLQEIKEVMTLTKNRNDLFKKDILNPKRFSPFLLPAKITTQLPSEVQPFLEKEMHNIEGKLEIRAILDLKGHETLQYLLRTANAVYFLHFLGEAPDNLKTDAILKINKAFQIPGIANENHLVVSASDLVILKNVSAIPSSLGDQPTIAFLVNFSDKPADRPFTPEYLNKLLFTNIRDWYDEVSYHQTRVIGKTVGWYVVSVPSTTPCNTLIDNVVTEADQIAISAGEDLSKYRHKMYFFPYNSGCPWGGLGTVGGNPSKGWVNGFVDRIRVTAHEFGHNVGLYHSRSIQCTLSPNEGDCTVAEYGDTADVMGFGETAHFNSFQKDVLGWLNYQVSPPITLVNKSGSYFIDAYETVDNKPKALKLLKREGGSDYYYLEYRQGIGGDKELTDCGGACDYTKGVIFHQGNAVNTSKIDLLDMSMEPAQKGFVALLPCKSFTDAKAPNGGVTFTVQSVSPQGAKVRIVYGAAKTKCFSQDPSLRLLTSYTPWITKGEKTTYLLEVTNNDAGKCAPRQLTLATDATPIKISFNPNNLLLQPNEMKQIQVTTESLNSLPNGIYPSVVALKNNVNAKVISVPISVGIYRN